MWVTYNIAQVNYIFTKPQLLQQIKPTRATEVPSVRPVLSKSFFLAHENVEYDKWYAATLPYQNQYDFFFEPYYIGLSKSYVEYDQEFSFYGHDKVNGSHDPERARLSVRWI